MSLTPTSRTTSEAGTVNVRYMANWRSLKGRALLIAIG
jgi:hypothetical protein